MFHHSYTSQKIKPCNSLWIRAFVVCVSTRSRDRTGTTLRSLVFETSASTDSAIRACFLVNAKGCKCSNFFLVMKPDSLFHIGMDGIGNRTGMSGRFNNPFFAIAISVPIRKMKIYYDLGHPSGTCGHHFLNFRIGPFQPESLTFSRNAHDGHHTGS